MKYIIIMLLTLVTGCSTIERAIDGAAQANDKALNTAHFTVCNGASIGSIRRKFNTPELSELWRKLCEDKQGFTPALTTVKE